MGDEMLGIVATGGEDDFKEEESFSQPKKVSDIKSKNALYLIIWPRQEPKK